MKLLILAILHKEFPQLLRKMNAKFLTLRKHFPDAQCYIIGNGDPGSMSEYAFKYIHNVWPEDQLACCENLMESLQPDLVYWRYPCAHPRLLDILERFPNVVFEHNTIEEMELKGEARKLELNLGSQILSRCAGIVGVTKEIVEYERTRSGRDLPAFVLPNSLNIVPSDKKVSHKASFAPSEVLQVLMVAVFDNWHGADRLIEGIAKSADKTRFALHLAGIGPSLPLYEKLIQRHGLQKQVFLHGWLDEKHLQNLYGNCHIAVGALGLIRKGMKEASAIKLREAATHGLPIILAGTDPDFSSELPFVHVVPNDESPLDLDAVYDFVKKWSQVPDGAIRIQDYASKKLTWTSRSVGWADFLRTLKPATVTSEASLSAQYNARPMFSIIMPCYRHAQYMPESIASLAAQNFKDIEVIIINDGSPDNTSEVARELIATWPQLNIRLLEQENMGLSEARNAGIRMARGHWILALDSDDKLAEGFLEAASRTIAENQHISLVAGMVCEFGERQSDWCYTNYNKTTLPNENTITCTAAYRRSLWETVEGYDPSNPWGWEDWHLWLRARKYGWVPFMINHPMLHYRIHLGVSMTDRLKTSLNEVSALHYTMLGNDYGINSILAAHITLQGMNQESLLRIKGKNRRFPDLPMPWFWIGLQHEGRGELDEALVCYIKAKHLDKSLQNKIDYGLQWQVEHRLYSLYSAKELHKKAAIARATLEKLKPEFKALLAEQDRLVNLATTATQTDKKRILLMCESFWPANNDNATFLEQTGFFLCQSGYEVHVLTRTLPQRKALEYKEIQIHEFPHYGNLEHNVIGGIDDFEFLVRRCGFSHIICFTHIEVWSSYLCMMSHPRPKVIILPILSNYDDLAKRNILADAMRVLEKADHVCRLTKQSMEAQLLKVAKIPTHFIPQVVPRIERHMSFRSIFGIDEKTPLFTHVADSWSAHELSLLLNELRLLQGNWRLAIIGEPDNPQSFSALQQNIAGDKRMLLLGPTEQNVTNSAIAEANVVLLSCKSEGYPTAILKAMSLGIPWLANPGNTSIYELLGGFVAETTRFPVILPEIINRNDLTSKLGRLGRRNWRDCFSPQVVLSAFIELIENNGANMPNIQRPEHLGKEQTLLRSRLYEHIFFMHGIRLW